MSENSSIEIRGLSCSYPDSGFKLKSIELSCGAGEALGVIGPSGAGKSTLLKAISGLIKVEGSISLFGNEVGKSLSTDLSRGIFYLQQNLDNQLVFNNPYDDIAFYLSQKGVKRSELRETVNNAAARIGISDQLQNKTTRLSYSQKKKVCLAPMFGKEFQLLLLDDPSAGLASGDRKLLGDLLVDYGRARIIVSPDLDFILKTCRRVVIMNRGEIVSRGLVNEVMSNQELMEENSLIVPKNISLYKSIYI